jgi:hypothetical protein
VQKITRRGSDRIVRYAFDLARRTGRKKVTIVHKANILKSTSGLFLKVAREVAAQYPDIACNEMIVDNCCMQLVMKPEQFDVICTTNLFGDIISDLCAGLVGGLGLAPGANIGVDAAIFEAVHGSAPDIAGKGIANPCALLLGAAQMLDHLERPEEATRLRTAIRATLEARDRTTPDLGGSGSTQAFADAVRKKTGQDPDYVHASSAAALIVIQKAIENGKSLEPEALRKAIADTNIQTFYGPIKFRADGMNENRNLPIIQIQGGKPVVLFPVDMQQAQLKVVAK